MRVIDWIGLGLLVAGGTAGVVYFVMHKSGGALLPGGPSQEVAKTGTVISAPPTVAQVAPPTQSKDNTASDWRAGLGLAKDVFAIGKDLYASLSSDL